MPGKQMTASLDAPVDSAPEKVPPDVILQELQERVHRLEEEIERLSLRVSELDVADAMFRRSFCPKQIR